MVCRLFKNVAMLSAVCALCGCATIVSSGPKTLPIMSQPDGAECEIVDLGSGNTILRTKTPYTATLQRSAGFFQPASYRLKISKQGYLPHEQQIKANLNGWYFGNIVFGGAVGVLIVDPLTGAMWSIYDKDINVKLYEDSVAGKIALATERYSGEEPFRNSDFDQAISDTTTALGYYPEYVDAYCVRSAAYARKGELDKAMTDANRAIELKPQHPRGYKERGELHAVQGDLAKALADLDRAVALKADYADALLARGKAQLKLNHQAEAKADLQSACTLGNSNACNFQF